MYDYARARITDDGDSLERYFDILPLESTEHMRGGVEPTPLVHARNLGRRYGLEQLWLKDETGHPTRTTKDRMAACTLSRFRSSESMCSWPAPPATHPPPLRIGLIVTVLARRTHICSVAPIG